MNILVRLGAGLLFGNGMPRVTVTLGSGSTVDDLLGYLLVQYPDLPINTAVPVIGGETVSRTRALFDGQEVALLLPIAGG